MTDTAKYGRALTGPECLSLNLPDTEVEYCGQTFEVSELGFCFEGPVYHLPADHPGYTLLDWNADNPDKVMTPWRGGDKAPDDVGDWVLVRNGEAYCSDRSARWLWLFCGSDIIGYTKRVDAAQQPTFRSAAVLANWPDDAKFRENDQVTTRRKPFFEGRVCGWYRNADGRLGYDVEAAAIPGLIHIYPETALQLVVEPTDPHADGSSECRPADPVTAAQEAARAAGGVFVPFMTEEEVVKYSAGHGYRPHTFPMSQYLGALYDFGIIRPEPTKAEKLAKALNKPLEEVEAAMKEVGCE